MMRWTQIIWLCTVSAVTTKCASIIGPQNVIIEHFPDEFNELGNNSTQETNEFSTGQSTNSDIDINLNISTQIRYNSIELMNLREFPTTDRPTTIIATTSSNTLEVSNAIPSEQPAVFNIALQPRLIPINNPSGRNIVADDEKIGDGNGNGNSYKVEEDSGRTKVADVVGGGNAVGGSEDGRIENEEEGEDNGIGDGEVNGGENNNTGGSGEGDDGEPDIAPTGSGSGTGDGSDNEVESGQGSGGSGEDGSGEGINGAGSGSGTGDATGNVEECPITDCVNTTSGLVRGYKWREKDKIIAYIDLPYGRIENAFERPAKAIYSEKLLHDQEHKKWCPQIKNDEPIGDIDCLTLSIFVPTLAERQRETASVLFHIHDPVIGSADPIVYDPENIVSKGVILVLPNYRIGAPGFLCMLNSTAPGNAGLKDLTLALEWVYDNIQVFGGNSSNIVVSGDGAAGALVGYLTLSPLSQHYIKRAITESGSALSPNALDRNPLKTAEHLEEILREQTSGEEVGYTFGDVPLKNIVEAAEGIPFKPCIELNSEEEPFMNNTPWHELNNNKINIDFMIGSASFAGTHEALTLTEDNIKSLNDDFSRIFPNDLHFKSTEERRTNGETTKLQYFGEKNVTDDDLGPLSLCFTDILYMGPSIRMARSLVASGATVYFYEFDFVGKLSQEITRNSRPVTGAIRSDIVRYVFKQVDVPIEEDSEDQQMVNLMINLWTTFIDQGKPSTPDPDPIKWTEFREAPETDEVWFHIASEQNVTTGVHVKRLSLWTRLYQNYYIERSFSVTIKPGDYVTYYAITMLLISFSKFNY